MGRLGEWPPKRTPQRVHISRQEPPPSDEVKSDIFDK